MQSSDMPHLNIARDREMEQPIHAQQLGTAYMGWSTCWVNLSLLDTMLGKPAYWCRERSQLDATLEMHNANLHLIGSCCEKYRLIKWYRCNIIGWMYVFSSFMCPHTCIYICIYFTHIYTPVQKLWKMLTINSAVSVSFFTICCIF